MSDKMTTHIKEKLYHSAVIHAIWIKRKFIRRDGQHRIDDDNNDIVVVIYFKYKNWRKKRE